MMTETQFTRLPGEEQFRIARLQVYNWGTFSGRHDIPVAERGFLFVGRSGSGKSTLLDAFAALLVPPRWVDFNAAARETERGGKDRSLVSYVRGAWAEQKSEESGETATQYLRKGTTWSALALTYRNESGQHVVLVRLLWLRGQASGIADVKRLYLTFEREVEIKELEIFGTSNFDVRVLKQHFPDAFVRDEFQPYCERFSRLLGIENEQALRLLHKTQSAKNLGDLNTFLRDFMLDKPPTFEVAERLVSEFGELNAAHQSVVTAREQMQLLVPARDRHQLMVAHQAEKDNLSQLQERITDYRDVRKVDLTGKRINELFVEAEGLDGEQRRQQDALDVETEVLRDLEKQHRDAGGDRIEQWEQDRAGLEGQRAERRRKRTQAAEAAQKLGKILPDSPTHFAQLLGETREELKNWELFRESTKAEQFQLAAKTKEVEGTFSDAVMEVRALRRQPSNIPNDMLLLRQSLAQSVGISEEALPFAGELIEVRASEAEWQGVIERVLRSFALSPLVSEKNYPALSQYINERYLGRHLRYQRMTSVDDVASRPLLPDSIFHKLNVKECPQREWLLGELRRSFNYACVDSGLSFRRADRAITREGQIKHSKSRHEKNDRYKIDDRRQWVLGFNNQEKLALFERQAQELGERLSGLQQQYATLDTEEKKLDARRRECQRLQDLEWHEIDVQSLEERVARLDQQIREAREGNAQLLELGERIAKQQARRRTAEKVLTDTKAMYNAVCNEIGERETKRENLEQGIARNPRGPLSAAQQQGLDERFAGLNVLINLDNLEGLTTDVSRRIAVETAEVQKKIHAGERFVEETFADFIARWKMDASDMQAKLASAPDFFARLTRLETDGLPAYEERFFELLRNQSQQNLASLSTHLLHARKDIYERMEAVNESLTEVPFNQDQNLTSYLRIETSDRQLVEVREFKQEIQKALSNAWTDDRTLAESRFALLRKLVDRLSSQDPEQRRWRESVLDVRQHIEFIGVEAGEDGAEIERWRSGAGKSGGQRQKLATTCLAAALRYQLGGKEHGLPKYGAVILDEAFDKADNEFTALAMKIFTNFGFQMIVATPLKSVMTIEPFIGGACFVEIQDRNTSAVLLIEYDDARKRLKLDDRTAEQASEELIVEVS